MNYDYCLHIQAFSFGNLRLLDAVEVWSLECLVGGLGSRSGPFIWGGELPAGRPCASPKRYAVRGIGIHRLEERTGSDNPFAGRLAFVKAA